MNEYTLVESDALHSLLLEVHDLRARQGVDWQWMDGMPPRLYAECVIAFEGVSETTTADCRAENGASTKSGAPPDLAPTTLLPLSAQER